MTYRELDRLRSYGSARQRFARLIHLGKARLRCSQQELVRWIGRWIPEHAVIFDVGAQFGNFTKAFSRLHGASCSIHAFEPLEYNYRILETVTAGLGNVHRHRLALSDRSGLTELYVPVKAHGKLGPGLAHFGKETGRDFIRERVEMQRLDDIAGDLNLTRLDFIKCDIEGAELPMLRGAADTLQSFRPVVYAEVNAAFTRRLGYTPDELFAFLHELAYEALFVDEKRLSAHPARNYLNPGNYLFTGCGTAGQGIGD